MSEWRPISTAPKDVEWMGEWEWETWRGFGNYTGGDCPYCGRARLMEATDPRGVDRVICEKCHWEPAETAFAGAVDARVRQPRAAR